MFVWYIGEWYGAPPEGICSGLNFYPQCKMTPNQSVWLVPGTGGDE